MPQSNSLNRSVFHQKHRCPGERGRFDVGMSVKGFAAQCNEQVSRDHAPAVGHNSSECSRMRAMNLKCAGLARREGFGRGRCSRLFGTARISDGGQRQRQRQRRIALDGTDEFIQRATRLIVRNRGRHLLYVSRKQCPHLEVAECNAQTRQYLDRTQTAIRQFRRTFFAPSRVAPSIAKRVSDVAR
jgi:hypothetical protein